MRSILELVSVIVVVVALSVMMTTTSLTPTSDDDDDDDASCPAELKLRTPAHTKHLGWYLEFESRVTQ